MQEGTKPVMSSNANIGNCTRKQTFRFLVVAWLILFVLTVPATAQPGKRLILKDGSWQGITKYEVVGARTRYFSSQRFEWEEIPYELVDWKATEEWNAQPMHIPPDDEEERSGLAPLTPDTLTVAPGLRLPMAGGVYLFDSFSGSPSLVELKQSQGVLHHSNSSVLHSAINPRYSFKQRLELRGSHARLQSHVPVPQIFVKISVSDQAQQIAPSDRYRIVKLNPNEDSRTLADVNVSVTGKQSQTQQFVPARIEGFGEGWLKVIPLRALEPGEYALVEMLDQNRFNVYAWDFGVDPHAPGNPNSQTAGSAANDKTTTSSR